MIPLCDVTQQYQDLKPEIDAAVEAVLAGGQYILGPNVKAFEQEVADYLGCNHAVGVGSGTDALHLALRALGVGPGDEVITTPFTFIASTEAIGLVGATPVFVDIDPQTYNIDPNQIEAAITPRTKAILPVHLYGQPCDMDAIMRVAERHAIPVVEDCAQAIGATYKGRRVGTFGVAGCFSFFPTKNLGCCGDGGMVVSNDARMFERVEMLRRHGGRKKYHHEELGLNSRLDELQAAILRIKLRHLDRWNCERRERAYRYNELFAFCNGIVRPAELAAKSTIVPTSIGASSDLVGAVYHQYTLLVDDRDAVQAALSAADIGNAIYYPVPLHLQRVHANLGHRPGDLPNAEVIANTGLSLPMFPELNDFQQKFIVDTFRQVTKTQLQESKVGMSASRRISARTPAVLDTFSLESYASLLINFLRAGYKFLEFRQADHAQSLEQPFVLLRHDIDLDLERALTMAKVEAALDVQTTYFFLLRTEHYNLFSKQGSKYIQEIIDLGHHLGLHFDCAAYNDACDDASFAQQVSREAALLGDWFEREISIVSFHRPAKRILSGSAQHSHPLEHTYLPKYVQQIHYYSDSRGEFRHGHPLQTSAFADREPMQLLIHPIWWGETAASAADELQQLVDRRQTRYLQSLADNCTVFRRPRRTATA